MSSWGGIEKITDNDNSVIKPKNHKDGRLIIMDYDDSQMSAHRHLSKSQNKKYIVHTDISNFFHSIYSHAIPWALVGFSESKKNKNDSTKWYNKLDKFQRLCKRDETMGVPIGPATSNIFAELLLINVDDYLASKGYVFTRFIDDYTAYCDSSEHAEKFIIELSSQLKKYKLTLNLKKTNIKKLPSPCSDDWVLDLSTRLPKSKKINYFDAIRFLDYAVHIHDLQPDGSILKYAVKAIIKKANTSARLSVAMYALNLSYKNPILIPLLDQLFLGLNGLSGFNLSKKLESILKENISNRRSDGICWSIFLLKKFCSHKLSNEIADSIIKTNDCLSIITLYASGGHDSKVISFASTVSNKEIFDIDEQWLLMYQLFLDKKIKNPYKQERLYANLTTSKESKSDAMNREAQCFNTLKKEGVSFINRDSMKLSTCNIASNGILRIVYSYIYKKFTQ